MGFTTFFGEPFDRVAPILPKLFGPMAADLVRSLREWVEWIDIEGGEILFRQGDEGDALYVVAGGRLQAIVEGADGEPRVVGEIAQGEPVGEMALITGDPRSATVCAVRDSLLMRLERSAFEQLVREHPDVLLHITRTLVARLSGSSRPGPAAPEVANITLLPLTNDAPSRELAEALTTALSRYGSAIRLTARQVDERTGKPGFSHAAEDGPEHVRLAAWLDRQSQVHRFVVYEADSADSPWTRRCLRQADRVLLVAPAHAHPSQATVDPRLADPQNGIAAAPRELVLVHPAMGQETSGTARWYEGRRLLRHHHVCCDRPGDVQRLARFLAGTAVGVVFAGGGARGFAHIGVIRALREAGVPLDLAGGTSMGAIVAATLATGWEAEELEEVSRRAFTTANPLSDYNLLPVVSLLKGRKIDQLLRTAFGERDIEDLWLPFFCVSSNLTRAEMTVHRHGPAWKAVRASLSLPGILPPVVYDDDLHVDGATFNNFPVDVLRSAGAGRVIAVDLDIRKSYDLDYENMPSSSEVLMSRLLPWRRRLKVPGLVNTVFKASALGGMQQRPAARAADLYLNPDVKHVGLLDFQAFDEVVEIGYRHTRDSLQELDVEKLR